MHIRLSLEIGYFLLVVPEGRSETNWTESQVIRIIGDWLCFLHFYPFLLFSSKHSQRDKLSETDKENLRKTLHTEEIT
jgi:hypothetical protein